LAPVAAAVALGFLSVLGLGRVGKTAITTYQALLAACRAAPGWRLHGPLLRAVPAGSASMSSDFSGAGRTS